MIVWVLFVWFSGNPQPVWSYDSQLECGINAIDYRKAACVKVEIPKK